ncbi:MAG: 16S rRNA (cytosine(1402)-N(4))-methyltransferase RsmH [Spirochaetales bacterium]|nr:16S rRNA (cytosine(1402)-N(4))-methyltransferase RsmH [Spirochaetales bacterium]
MRYSHKPVMVQSIDSLMEPGNESCVFVDATLGEGGYAHYFLEKYPQITYIGVDADFSILEKARQRLESFGGRVRLYNQWFTDFFSRYPHLDLPSPDCVLFDLGISRYHYEKSGRGFAFSVDERLDMRLNPDQKISAYDIINTFPEDKIADILIQYGEEKRFGRRIAWKIVQAREEKPINSTFELVKVINSAMPPSDRYKKRIHPATRCFQALRIAVNNELNNLETSLEYAFAVLKPDGRMGVVSYHSLEDRIVKRFFREKNKTCTCPENWPICQCKGQREVNLLTRKPVMADEGEISANPSSRSARLRVVRKLAKEEIE